MMMHLQTLARRSSRVYVRCCTWDGRGAM